VKPDADEPVGDDEVLDAPVRRKRRRSPSVSSPGTRKSASFDSSPSSSSRTAPPTRYASSPSPRTYFSISSRIRPFSPDRRSALQQCDRLDLDERAGGELRHLHGRRAGGCSPTCFA
jgi:hypothetical protein